MPTLEELGLDKLDMDERAAIADALWESVKLEIENNPLTAAQAEELRRRLARADANPDDVVPWEEVRARLEARGAALSAVVVLRREAVADMDDAFDWYEAQRAGLGLTFVRKVQQAVARISSNPNSGSMLSGGVRRLLIPRSPYALLFRSLPAHVEVIAVFHAKRNPAIWQGRVVT